MPGVKSVVWTESNKAALFDALTAYQTIRVSDQVATNIAKHVGGTCTTKAIHSILARGPAKFKPANGAPPAPAPGTVKPALTANANHHVKKPAAAKPCTTTNTKASNGNGNVKVKREAEEGEEPGPSTPLSKKPRFDFEDSLGINVVCPITPPESLAEGKRTKTSPRARAPVDYSALNDPLAKMIEEYDDNAAAVDSASAPSVEDSEPSDAEFKVEEVEVDEDV